MTNKILHTKVAGVTFEGRQNLIAQLRGDEPCRLCPEPDNKYDVNAIAVMVAHGGNVLHIGYLPRDLAAQVSPHLEGESLMVKIVEITGGFEFDTGETAAFGVRLRIELPGLDEVVK